MTNIAPICLSVYKRLNHLKQTVSALKKNTLAGESSLYIFSDHPVEGDEKEVQEVRKYLREIDGFRDVLIIEREENDRVANNRKGIKKLLDDFGKVIFLEEDIVTAPGFLCYLNSALDFYKGNESVISISAYCPPIEIPADYSYSTFFLPRFNAWGFGTWKDKFDPFGFNLKDYKKNMKNNSFLKKMAIGGDDIFNMVQADYNGNIDALDVKVMYHQVVYNRYTAYPRSSMVQNIGHDGSGVHCSNTNKFFIENLWQKHANFFFTKEVKLDSRIVLANKKFRELKKKKRIFDRIFNIIFSRRNGL